MSRRRRDAIERQTPGHVEHRGEERKCEDERQAAARRAADARRRHARPRRYSCDTARLGRRRTPARHLRGGLAMAVRPAAARGGALQAPRPQGDGSKAHEPVPRRAAERRVRRARACARGSEALERHAGEEAERAARGLDRRPRGRASPRPRAHRTRQATRSRRAPRDPRLARSRPRPAPRLRHRLPARPLGWVRVEPRSRWRQRCWSGSPARRSRGSRCGSRR